jgi:hypothetical protein
MKDRFKTMALVWSLVIGLMVSMGISSISYAQTATLTDAEKNWLTYMREEEKLAHDVYEVFYTRWGLPIFSNIANSEQRHMDAIKTLLDRYGLADPAAGKPIGKFLNQDLQELYDELVDRGESSVVEALKVGVDIEETDMDDLSQALAAAKRKDIKTVYSNLYQGSLNHLKAFVSTLAGLGVVYQP